MTEAANAAADVENLMGETRPIMDMLRRASADEDEVLYREAADRLTDAYAQMELRIARAREALTRELTQEAAAGTARMGQVADEGNAEVDQLVRALMRRMEGWEPRTRDEFFAAGDRGSGLDQQFIRNRVESQRWRQENEGLNRSLGDDEASIEDTRMPSFPSKLGRQVPQVRGRGRILAAILDAIGRE
jgi:hypothetical protein